jgi:hypothetical protein
VEPVSTSNSTGSQTLTATPIISGSPQGQNSESSNSSSGGPTNTPASVQQQLALLLTGDPTNKSLFEDSRLNPLLSALAKGGSEETIVLQLAKSLLGLFRGYKVDPKRLLAAVAAYNALIKASRAEFLKTPPPELLAIREILSQLVEAARAADIQPGNN